MKKLHPNKRGIEDAAHILNAGGIVAFPTETVYGLGARADNSKAVAKIYEAKGRPHFNPLIAHVASFEEACALIEIPPLLEKLAHAFWPGGLSLVAPQRENTSLSKLATAGLNTLAVRVPNHEIAHALLKKTGVLVAPSANKSGHISPTSAHHVARTLKGRIDAVIEGEISTIGLESTIITENDGDIILLREGGIAREEIEAFIKKPIKYKPSSESQSHPQSPLESPGQLLSHYAPHVPLRMNITHPKGDELFLGFGLIEKCALNLSDKGDLSEAARNLFSYLHILDARALEIGYSIAVAPIPQNGLGAALNDRLKRASAASNWRE